LRRLCGGWRGRGEGFGFCAFPRKRLRHRQIYGNIVGVKYPHIYEREFVCYFVGMEKNTAKRAKFRDLAESRTNKALEAIARIGNLSNRQVYEYDEAEVRKIAKALRDAVSQVEARFDAPKARGERSFKL
jgi:hypothetical protein